MQAFILSRLHMVLLSAAFNTTVGELNNGTVAFVNFLFFFIFIEICKQWLNAGTGIVHNEISLNNLVPEM